MYCRHFDSIDICKYRSDWMEYRCSGVLPQNAVKPLKLTEIEIFETTEVEVGLFQESLRYVCCHNLVVYFVAPVLILFEYTQSCRSKAKSGRNQVDLCVVLLRNESKSANFTRIAGCSKRQLRSFVGFHAVLEPGHYTLVPLAFNHWSPCE